MALNIQIKYNCFYTQLYGMSKIVQRKKNMTVAYVNPPPQKQDWRLKGNLLVRRGPALAYGSEPVKTYYQAHLIYF